MYTRQKRAMAMIYRKWKRMGNQLTQRPEKKRNEFEAIQFLKATNKTNKQMIMPEWNQSESEDESSLESLDTESSEPSSKSSPGSPSKPSSSQEVPSASCVSPSRIGWGGAPASSKSFACAARCITRQTRIIDNRYPRGRHPRVHGITPDPPRVWWSPDVGGRGDRRCCKCCGPASLPASVGRARRLLPHVLLQMADVAKEANAHWTMPMFSRLNPYLSMVKSRFDGMSMNPLQNNNYQKTNQHQQHKCN